MELEIRKVEEPSVTLPKKAPMFSSGCKIGTSIFVVSIIVIGVIFLAVSLGGSK